ncbi:hypothetical protein AA313_de0202016 [Arthrobotrys entomopaga]|nr:hypothetical protein AA313_de0202016 [Arthrobotrys entomopaga]
MRSQETDLLVIAIPQHQHQHQHQCSIQNSPILLLNTAHIKPSTSHPNSPSTEYHHPEYPTFPAKAVIRPGKNEHDSIYILHFPGTKTLENFYYLKSGFLADIYPENRSTFVTKTLVPSILIT